MRSAAHLAILATGALLFGSGCVSAPEIRHPDLDVGVPDAWTGGGGEPSPPGSVSPEWWTDFGDPGLTEAVRLARERNFDLRAAAARVERAVAEARIAGADLAPAIALGLNRSRQKRNFIGFSVFGGGGGSQDVISNTFTNWGASLDVSWEIDLWGRIRAATRASLADLQASDADYQGALLSVAGQTAKAWFAATEARQQVLLSERSVTSYRESYDQVRSRYNSGLRSPLDVRLASANLEDAEATLRRRRQDLDAAVRQLEVLVGRYPGGRIPISDSFDAVPAPVPAGLPAELVSRRPDLVAAERRLASADERVLEARRALLPGISLTASGGTATEDFRDLLDRDFRVWDLLLNLTQPLFQGGRLRAGVSRAEAMSREALATYASDVLGAYAEVESALTAEGFLRERVAHLREAASQAAAAQRLAEDRYRSGLEDYVTVLEAQRRALTNESSLLAARRLRLDNRVDLYLALGGGFEVPEERPSLLRPASSLARKESAP